MRRRQRGHALLELAISAGVMVSSLAGTFQFGYTFFVYNQLVTAVGNAGRYAAQRTYRAHTPDDVEKAKAAIKNMVVYGDARPGDGATPVVRNLKPENIDVHWINDPSGRPTAVHIQVSHYDVDAVFHTFNFAGRPAVEFPFVGRYAPEESEQ